MEVVLNEIIGRKEQQYRLGNCLESHKSELVCVYGRRRVGKTYLVRSFFNGEFSFQVTAGEHMSQREKLALFTRRLKESSNIQIGRINDWIDAFAELRRVLDAPDVIRENKYGKRVVFIDEFPWFASRRSNFVEAFAHFWNDYSPDNPDLIVIICGSSTSWVIKNILNAKGSLYKRPTDRILLSPFTLAETEDYFNMRRFDWDRETILLTQMVFGGLPYYLDALDRRESLAQNIDRLCLNIRGALHEETFALIESTLRRKSDTYELIFRELSRHRDGMLQDNISKAIGVSSTAVGLYIEELAKCEYVAKAPVPHKKGHNNMIRLIDPFILFHYRFIDPDDPDRKIEHWQEFVESGGAYYDWRGHAFEVVCHIHKDNIINALSYRGSQSKVYPWSSTPGAGGAQLDLVVRRPDRIIDICEMKFTDAPFKVDRAYREKLRNKKEKYREETGTKWPIHIVMVSVNGLVGGQYSDEIYQLVGLDDLFRD